MKYMCTLVVLCIIQEHSILEHCRIKILFINTYFSFVSKINQINNQSKKSVGQLKPNVNDMLVISWIYQIKKLIFTPFPVHRCVQKGPFQPDKNQYAKFVVLK